ncbi:MAG: putative portal protein [Prokaryotic dsDNA virus sp.]|nr:MAG: putative portal protein [Prokaryotic dsDNA virus sp.]|tara:strand:- start:2402 stop:4441 length:2040 start_codon:yes stop_codon:yes gene_type:complete
MKDNIININLETSTAPVIQEVRGRDWIEYGDANGEWRNLYPQFLVDLYYSSSISAAIINATAEMIAGENLVIEDDDNRNLEARVKLQNFMDRANGSESLHEVLKKVAFDFKLQGAFALNIVWSKDRTQIAEIYHVGVEKVRCCKPDEFGKTKGYYISADWSNTRQNKPYYVPAFNTNDRTSANQILYSGLYSPNMNSYYTPDYVSCNNWALIDARVSEYHLNNISNGFAGSFMISFANGVPTQEERLKIEQSLTDKFCSETNAGKFVLTFSDDKTRTPEITPISTSDLDKSYLALQELLTQNILSGHRCTSPMLMGIKSDTGLGNNADELNSAANFYLNTVVKPYQDQIVKQLRKIFQVNDMDMPVNFVQLKPITVKFTSEDLKSVMTQDEIREELGLEPLETKVDVDLSKIGMIDGEPVFSTIEEAEAHAKTLGCEGYHEHEYEGKTAYMACKDHSEATELNDCDCKKTNLKVEKTELESFIEDFGEDIPEDWEMVDEEIVDGEHQDFDFEKELNDLANERLELVSTGTARPNARSSQDGTNKSDNDFYKVRYVYTKDNFLSQKGETRDFCRLMTSANKVYRKEDILQMTNRAVNPGWGPRGANTYSIWLYKGGGNCHHFWLRRIYKTSLRGAKSNIKPSQAISYTKALSEGFTAEKNDNLVARPPKRMKNQGFLEPR